MGQNLIWSEKPVCEYSIDTKPIEFQSEGRNSASHRKHEKVNSERKRLQNIQNDRYLVNQQFGLADVQTSFRR